LVYQGLEVCQLLLQSSNGIHGVSHVVVRFFLVLGFWDGVFWVRAPSGWFRGLWSGGLLELSLFVDLVYSGYSFCRGSEG
jgi:hypothetical protein